MFIGIKKYLFILSAAVLFSALAFMPKLFSFAQGPAFEVYGPSGGCNNTHPYPLVVIDSPPVVSEDKHLVTITAHVCDTSGVALVAANIEKPNGDGVDYVNLRMYDDGDEGHGDASAADGIYSTLIDVSDNTSVNPDAPWDYNASYNVDITAVDKLYIRNDGTQEGDTYYHITSFSISGNMPTSINGFAASPSSASPGAIINLSAKLDDFHGTGMPGETLNFFDVTNPGNPIIIGDATTDGSGVANIGYSLVLSMSPGERALKVAYLGADSLPSEETTTVDVSSMPELTTVELWQTKAENPDPFSNTHYHAYNVYGLDSRNQLIVLASDLIGAGLRSGDIIAGIELKASELPGSSSLDGFRIRMKQTESAETTSWEGGWTTFFGPADVSTVTDFPIGTSYKSYMFDSTIGLHWDGTSNVMVDLARSGSDTGVAYGGLWWRENVGTNRTFAGYVGHSGTQGAIYEAVNGGAPPNSASITSNSCPDLKIIYAGSASSGAPTQISINAQAQAQPLGVVSISAELTGGGGAIAGAMIYFQDDGDNIGWALTNSSGIAQINYTIPSGATQGNHALKAIYPGNLLGNLLSSEQTTIMSVITNNPVPTLVTLSVSSAVAGASQIGLTLTGTNFIPASVVKFAGTAKATTYISATQVTATIPASDLTSAGTFDVTVYNPAPGGGTSGVQTFIVNNPIPTTTGISPASKIKGDGYFDLTVNGTNLNASSVVKFNNSDRVTTYVSPTQVTAAIPASDLTVAGSFLVKVYNPAPGGGTSVVSQTFRVFEPVPTTTGISPASKTKGDTAFTITVDGTNFVSGAIVRFNGTNRATTYVSPTQVTASILTSDLTTAGTFDVVVFTTGGTSNAQTFIVNNQAPATTSISPASKVIGSLAFNLTVNGSNFIPASVVRFNGLDRATTYGNTGQVTAAIPASDLTAAGSFDITVYNPAPGGGTSGAKTFTVNNLTPTLTSISPISKFTGTAGFTMVLAGSNFIPGAVVKFSGSDRVTTYISSTEVRAAIPGSDLAVVGAYNITVANPAPVGGPSTGKTFTVLSNTVELWTGAGSAEYQWGGVSAPQDPYNTSTSDSRAQFIILNSDLSGVGFGSGDTITSISLKDSSQPGRTLKNFRIRAKLIPATTITTTVWSANTWTNTYGPTDIPNTDIGLSFGNWKEYAFSSGLVWDGTSNIMVDISRDDTAASAGGGMYIKTDTSIGASRSLVGNCNSCTLYFAVSGTTGGAAAHNWVPTIKVTHIPAP